MEIAYYQWYKYRVAGVVNVTSLRLTSPSNDLPLRKKYRGKNPIFKMFALLGIKIGRNNEFYCKNKTNSNLFFQKA